MTTSMTRALWATENEMATIGLAFFTNALLVIVMMRPDRYELTVPTAALLREALRKGPREAAKRLRQLARWQRGARQIEAFLT